MVHSHAAGRPAVTGETARADDAASWSAEVIGVDGGGSTAQGPTGPADWYDVAVIGAGVVGCAIARELARFPVRTVVLEAADDVGAGTSKANSAILHCGFDSTPGTAESRLVRHGHRLLTGYAAQAGIPLEPVGALLVAWDDEQFAALPRLAVKAAANGYPGCRIVDRSELYQREPQLGEGARAALEVLGEGLICPWTTTLAFARQAVTAGVEFRLGTRLTSVQVGTGGRPHQLTTSSGQLQARHLVNAAGLTSDQVDRWMGCDGFTVTPRRGQLIVFDKLARPLVNHILLPVPTARSKGVLILPTVYGNVLLGPTAEELTDCGDTGTTAEGLAELLRHGERIMPALVREEVTAVYAGLRAATEHGDYQLRGHPELHYVCVGGIRSTGLTASMAIAEQVTGLLVEGGLGLRGPRDLEPVSMPNLGEAGLRPYQRDDLIAADPEYGRIVCHCERVSRGEIRDALTGVLPARTLDGLRRRTRVLMGRCQGFYCGAEVQEAFRSAAGAEAAAPVSTPADDPAVSPVLR
jgi:glycerol-3-phosphate dehydrogenase